MLIDMAALTAFSWLVAKALNMVFFKRAPATTFVTWALTLAYFICGVILASVTKFFRGAAISKSLGISMSAQNPMDMGTAFIMALVFYQVLNRTSKKSADSRVQVNSANPGMSIRAPAIASIPTVTSGPPSVTFTAPLSVASSGAAIATAASISTSLLTQSITHEISEMESIEDRIYSQVGEELEFGNTDKGIWTKAFAQAGGDDKNTRVLYIQARVAKLLALEDEKEKARLAEQQAAAAEKVRLARMALKKKISEGAIGREEAERETEGMSTAFLLAVRNGPITVVERMVQDRPYLLAVRNPYGESCLHAATRKMDSQMIEFLVDSGAYVNARNDNGDTARDIARRENLSELVALFDAIALRANITGDTYRRN